MTNQPAPAVALVAAAGFSRAGVVRAGAAFTAGAGAPDTVAGQDPYAALEGRKGAVLWAVSTRDGKKLTEAPLKAPPVPDGMAAAGGMLFLATIDGNVLCLGEKE